MGGTVEFGRKPFYSNSYRSAFWVLLLFLPLVAICFGNDSGDGPGHLFSDFGFHFGQPWSRRAGAGSVFKATRIFLLAAPGSVGVAVGFHGQDRRVQFNATSGRLLSASFPVAVGPARTFVFGAVEMVAMAGMFTHALNGAAVGRFPRPSVVPRPDTGCASGENAFPLENRFVIGAIVWH